jgi:DNA uptake protein ComE-like DNA-binding protein
MAHDIVEYREVNGKFTSVNEILKVESVDRDFLNINRYRIHTGEGPRLGS